MSKRAITRLLRATGVAALTAGALVAAVGFGPGPAHADDASHTHSMEDADGMDGMDMGGTETTTTTASSSGEDTGLAQCPDALHDSYTATAQNGASFPTWHPAVVTDPATGQECTFGHEHGDDPSTSDIYEWTLDKLGAKASGITFGFAASMTEYMDGAHHRHEDHYGHKVFVLNNVAQVRQDRAGYAKDASGAKVVCDYLIYEHQGSHSGDALKNNSHELLYSARCTDGTEVVFNSMTGYGNANEFTENCTLDTVKTSGSTLANGTGGARVIPTVDCVKQTAGEAWGRYEVWQADHTVKDASGKTVLAFDPWFGVRNPSRVGDGVTPVDTISLLSSVTGAAATTYPWKGIDLGTAKNSVESPFNGAQRDVYVQHTAVSNAGGATTLYTDALGQKVSTTSFEGAIAQYVASVDNTDLPELERRAFGFSTDYSAGNGVHASN